MSRKTLLIASVLTALVSGGVMAGDGHESHKKHQQKHSDAWHHEGHERSFLPILKHLDLTDQQQQAIKSLHANKKADHEASRMLHQQNKQQMQSLLAAEQLDESAIKALSLQMAEIRSDKIIAKAKQKREILALLTEQQRAKYAEIKEKRQQKRQHRKELH